MLWRTEREPRLMQNDADFMKFNLLIKEYASVNKEISKVFPVELEASFRSRPICQGKE